MIREVVVKEVCFDMYACFCFGWVGEFVIDGGRWWWVVRGGKRW